MDFLKLAWFRIQVRVGITTSEARALVAVAGLLLAGVLIEQVRLRQQDRQTLVFERATTGEDKSALVAGTDAAMLNVQDLQAKDVQDIQRAALININRATVAELDMLPGIGPALAQRIVDHRDRYGPFVDVESMVMVRGIGPRTMDELRELVVVATDSATVAPTQPDAAPRGATR